MQSVRWRLLGLSFMTCVVAACGGGGGGTEVASSPAASPAPGPVTTPAPPPPAVPPPPPPPPPPQPADVKLTAVVLVGTQSGGYAPSARVCLDENADLVCGNSELTANIGNDKGEASITVPGAELSRLSGARLIASVLYGPATDDEVVMVAKPYAAGTTRYVLSPLTTHVEQLVLATMPRNDAVQVVRELAGLRTLAVDDDYVATGTGVPEAEAQSAKTAGSAITALQVRSLIDLVKAPPAGHLQASTGTGLWFVQPSSSGTSGSMSRVMAQAVPGGSEHTNDQRRWTYGPTTGYSAPQDTTLSTGAYLTGPILEETGTWTSAGVDRITFRHDGGRQVEVFGGKPRSVGMRSDKDMSGQLVQVLRTAGQPSSGYISTLETPYSPGARLYPDMLYVELSSRLHTGTSAVAGVDGAGQTVVPAFASLDALVGFYREAANQWLDIGTNGLQMSATDTELARFRRVQRTAPGAAPTVLQDHGTTIPQLVTFAGTTVLRVPLPEGALVPVGVGTMRNRVVEFVVRDGSVRHAELITRGGLVLSASRAANRIATEDILRALRWNLPAQGW